MLDAAAHRRGRAREVRRGLHPARAGSAAAPPRLERAGPRPAGRRAGRGADHRLAGGELAGDKRTAADLAAWLVFEDESGQGLRPPTGRTWGRRGRTPVVRVTARNSPRLSLAALLATRPGHRPRLIYRTYRGRRGGRRKGFTEADYAALLDAAHQRLGGPIVLVWDNLNTHTSAAMSELIAARPWLTVYRLPPYAHELNPVEPVWSHLKRSLANLIKHTLVELTALVKTRLRRMQYRPGLLLGFLAGTGLEFGPFL
ncbi:transposase [Geodermatophilus sp. URMC 65]